MAEDKVQIAFYGSEDYRAYVQGEALKRRMKVQEFLEQAVRQYSQHAADEEIKPKLKPSEIPRQVDKSPSAKRIGLFVLQATVEDLIRAIDSSGGLQRGQTHSPRGPDADILKLGREADEAIGDTQEGKPGNKKRAGSQRGKKAG